MVLKHCNLPSVIFHANSCNFSHSFEISASTRLSQDEFSSIYRSHVDLKWDKKNPLLLMSNFRNLHSYNLGSFMAHCFAWAPSFYWYFSRRFSNPYFFGDIQIPCCHQLCYCHCPLSSCSVCFEVRCFHTSPEVSTSPHKLVIYIFSFLKCIPSQCCPDLDCTFRQCRQLLSFLCSTEQQELFRDAEYFNQALKCNVWMFLCLNLQRLNFDHTCSPELIGGIPSLKINHGSGTLVLQLNNPGVSDRRWHRLDVKSNSKVRREIYNITCIARNLVISVWLLYRHGRWPLFTPIQITGSALHPGSMFKCNCYGKWRRGLMGYDRRPLVLWSPWGHSKQGQVRPPWKWNCSHPHCTQNLGSSEC